jgi:WD40 repeat protein
MRFSKYKFIALSSELIGASYLLITIALVAAALWLAPGAEAQRTTRTGTATSLDDVVFAHAFSPDGRTLAIARGASDPVNRFGRIELWDIETGKLLQLIKGFDGPVKSISFSPDGNTLISTSAEFRSSKLQQKVRAREGIIFGELKWWDVRTGELKHKLTLPEDEESFSVRAIQSPDGKQLALVETFSQIRFYTPSYTLGAPVSNSMDLAMRRASYMPLFRVRLKLVDPQTGELRQKLDVGQAGAVTFSPDGKLLAVANGKEVKLWNSQTGKEVRKLKGLKGTVNAVAFSPSGTTLAVASTKYEREYAEHLIKIIGISEVVLFDVNSGKVNNRLSEVGAVNTLTFSPGGRILVVGGVLPDPEGRKGEAAGMKFFYFDTGKVTDLATGPDYKEAVDSVALTRDGHWLAFRSGPATVKLFDTQAGSMKHTWDADSVGDAVERPSSRFLLSVKRVLAVAFSADGLTVAGESDQGEIKLWDQRTGEVKRHLSIEQDQPSLVAVSADGSTFAEVSQGKLLFWNSDSETKMDVPLPGPNTISALALSADGQTLAVSSGNELTLLSPDGAVVKKLAGQQGPVGRLVFSRDGRKLAGADEGGAIRIWNITTGGIEKTLAVQTEITALVFAPDGQKLAAAASDRTVGLWDLQSGLPQGRFQKHDDIVNALAFSPNGQLLASGGDDRTIVIWEVAAGKSKRTFKGHDQTVTSLAFSPDGKLLASGSGNASVVLWEVGSGKLNRVLN